MKKIALFTFLMSLLALTAQAAKLQLTEHDVVVGDKDADVLIVEYASMTCGHCANFHKDVYPKLKEEYIDTGKVAFVFRHMPWGNLALAVSKITECAGEQSRDKFVSAFFNTQNDWLRSKDPLASIAQIAKLGGMDKGQVDTCLLNAELHERIIKQKEHGMGQLAIESTPTVFINDERIVGTRSYETYKKMIEEKLK